MKILVVFTGGTIGSTNSGGLIFPEKINSFKLLNLYEKIDNDVEFTSARPYMILSENLCGENLAQLYNCIKSNDFEKYNGVIVTHGTDTLQYAAAFLSYAFGLCKTPVVFASANYPLDDKRSNGLANFSAAVDFIRAREGRGVFVSYRNDGENPKIHRASRLVSHLAYSDCIYSALDDYYGEIINGKFCRNLYYSELEDEISIDISQISREFSDVLKINSYVGMTFPELTFGTKAVLIEGYHSGTLSTSHRALKNFCKKADSLNIPVFLTGSCRGFNYESKEKFDELKIRILPAASPIAMYMKLWMLENDRIDEVYSSRGGDFSKNI